MAKIRNRFQLLIIFIAMEDLLLPCLNKELLGVECFGCGIQRSLVFLCKGEFVKAFQMYPAIYTLILLLLFLIVNIFYKFKYDTVIRNVLIAVNLLIILIAYFYKLKLF